MTRAFIGIADFYILSQQQTFSGDEYGEETIRYFSDLSVTKFEPDKPKVLKT